MAIRRARLYARFSNPDGGYPRVAIEFAKNGKAIEPKKRDGWELLTYQVRIIDKFVAVGKHLGDAVDRLRQEQARLADGVSATEAVKTESVIAADIPESDDGRIRIAAAAAKFAKEMKDLNRDRYTVAMYENALRDFQTACPKVVYVDEITREAVLNFLGWMRKNLKVRVEGSQEVTYVNKLRYLSTFLGRQGVQLYKQGSKQSANDPGLLFRTDRPKVLKKRPKKYDRDQIEALMENADVDERDYFEFLNWSGFRSGEVEHLLYSDFDFKNSTVSVHAKPQFGWKPKDYEERTVTLPPQVTARFKERMNRAQQFQHGMRKPEMRDLVFTTKTGVKDAHLIRRLHAVAKKAGLKLKGQRAGHMFRKTAGSRIAKKYGLAAAMEFLGHSDIKTTALYLAADSHDVKKKRNDAAEMYAAGD